MVPHVQRQEWGDKSEHRKLIERVKILLLSAPIIQPTRKPSNVDNEKSTYPVGSTPEVRSRTALPGSLIEISPERPRQVVDRLAETKIISTNREQPEGDASTDNQTDVVKPNEKDVDNCVAVFTRTWLAFLRGEVPINDMKLLLKDVINQSYIVEAPEEGAVEPAATPTRSDDAPRRDMSMLQDVAIDTFAFAAELVLQEAKKHEIGLRLRSAYEALLSSGLMTKSRAVALLKLETLDIAAGHSLHRRFLAFCRDSAKFNVVSLEAENIAAFALIQKLLFLFSISGPAKDASLPEVVAQAPPCACFRTEVALRCPSATETHATGGSDGQSVARDDLSQDSETTVSVAAVDEPVKMHEAFLRVNSCRKLSSLYKSILEIVSKHQLSVLRVTDLILLHLQYFLPVIRHDLLALLLVLLGDCRAGVLEEAICLQLHQYQEAYVEGHFCVRGQDLLMHSRSASSIQKRTIAGGEPLYLYPPAKSFYQLLAFLMMEGHISIDKIWHKLAPTNTGLKDLVRYLLDEPLTSTSANSSVDNSSFSDPVPKSNDIRSQKHRNSIRNAGHSFENAPADCDAAILTHAKQICLALSEGKGSSSAANDFVSNKIVAVTPMARRRAVLNSLFLPKINFIEALIELNGWNVAVRLMGLLQDQVAGWSFALHPCLLNAVSSLTVWLGYRLEISKPAISAVQQADSGYANVLNNGPSEAYDDSNAKKVFRFCGPGSYASPYEYGSFCPLPEQVKYATRFCGKSQFTCPLQYLQFATPLLHHMGFGLAGVDIGIVEVLISGSVRAALCLEEEHHGILIRAVEDHVAADVLAQKTTLANGADAVAMRNFVSWFCDFMLLIPTMLWEVRYSIGELIWDVLKVLPLQTRYKVYSRHLGYLRFLRETNLPPSISSQFLDVKMSLDNIRVAVTKSLKRSTAENARKGGPTQREKAVGEAVQKVSIMSPYEVFSVVLDQVEMFDQMLSVVLLNAMPALSPYVADVGAFLIVERSCTRESQPSGVYHIAQTKPKKLKNLAYFAARFFRRYHTVPVEPLLLSIADRFEAEISDAQYPDVLGGRVGDFVLLQELIHWMGCVPAVPTEEMNNTQLSAVGAGPHLRLAILLNDNSPDDLFAERRSLPSHRALKDCLSKKELFANLFLGMARQRTEVMLDSDLLASAGSLRLRAAASLADDLYRSMLQLVSFLSLPDTAVVSTGSSPPVAPVDLSRDPSEYVKILPPLSTLLQTCEPTVLWSLVRPTFFPMFESSVDEAVPPAAKKTFVVDWPHDLGIHDEARRYVRDIQATISRSLLPACVNPDFRDLYEVFWSLQLMDIWIPSDVYSQKILGLKRQYEQVSKQLRSLQRKSCDGSDEALRRADVCFQDAGLLEEESASLQQQQQFLEAELSILLEHRQKVILALRKRKSHWFAAAQEADVSLKNNEEAAANEVQGSNMVETIGNTSDERLALFIEHMLCHRVLGSHADALFCAKFVALLVEMDTEGFDLVKFMRKLTALLVPFVRSCTIEECDWLGLFFDDILKMLRSFAASLKLERLSEKKNKTAKDEIEPKTSPCLESLSLAVRADDQNATINKKEGQNFFSPDVPIIDCADNAVDLSPSESPKDGLCEDVEDTSGESVADKVTASPTISPAPLSFLSLLVRWENRIFRFLQRGLLPATDDSSWMAQRIALKFLNKTHRNFPLTDLSGNEILTALPSVIAAAQKRKWNDVVANALALERNLADVQGTWIRRGAVLQNKDTAVSRLEVIRNKAAFHTNKTDKSDGDIDKADTFMGNKDVQKAPQKVRSIDSVEVDLTPLREVKKSTVTTPNKRNAAEDTEPAIITSMLPKRPDHHVELREAKRPSEKPSDRSERQSDRSERPSERSERASERSERPLERPERPSERSERPLERPERPSERPERPSERPERPSERPERPSERLERPFERLNISLEAAESCRHDGNPRKIVRRDLGAERKETTTRWQDTHEKRNIPHGPKNGLPSRKSDVAFEKQHYTAVTIDSGPRSPGRLSRITSSATPKTADVVPSVSLTPAVRTSLAGKKPSSTTEISQRGEGPNNNISENVKSPIIHPSKVKRDAESSNNREEEERLSAEDLYKRKIRAVLGSKRSAETSSSREEVPNSRRERETTNHRAHTEAASTAPNPTNVLPNSARAPAAQRTDNVSGRNNAYNSHNSSNTLTISTAGSNVRGSGNINSSSGKFSNRNGPITGGFSNNDIDISNNKSVRRAGGLGYNQTRSNHLSFASNNNQPPQPPHNRNLSRSRSRERRIGGGNRRQFQQRNMPMSNNKFSNMR